MTTMTATNYKGRVWTCDTHDKAISALIALGDEKGAKLILKNVHPKKGNECRECRRLFNETPSFNR